VNITGIYFPFNFIDVQNAPSDLSVRIVLRIVFLLVVKFDKLFSQISEGAFIFV
jgi:hypothetical protein